MASSASVAKHPIHPMLVVFPIGLWVFSLIADIIFLSGGNPEWASVAYYNIIAGVVGAVIAAFFGFIDWVTLQPSKAKTIGTWHMIINLIVAVLFFINFEIRRTSLIASGAATTTGALVLSIIGVAMLLVSGWLGGEMVYVHGLAVEGKSLVEKQQPEQKQREKTPTGTGYRS